MYMICFKLRFRKFEEEKRDAYKKRDKPRCGL